VFNVYSGGEGSDLSGSDITADRPIAVFSGNIGTAYDNAAGAEFNSVDMTHEQMMPLTTWGRRYVAARLDPQVIKDTPMVACNPSEIGKTRWRILAAEDDTEVSFDHGVPLTGLPDAPLHLGRGEVAEIVVGSTPGARGDFIVEATRPVLVAQFQACEPAMALTVSAEQLLTDFLFVTPPIFEHQVAVVRKAGTEVRLDGRVISDANFAVAGGGFEVARLGIPNCVDALETCGHRIQGTDIGVALRGQDGICGYAFAGGMGFRCVNKTAGCR